MKRKKYYGDNRAKRNPGSITVFFKAQDNLGIIDTEADVLYLHFKKPNHADNSEMTEDEIIVRYEDKEIIGVTILNASQRI